MWLPTHMFFYSSETDGEDPTGSHKLASVLDTHPNGRVHQHWAAGTSCVSVTRSLRKKHPPRSIPGGSKGGYPIIWPHGMDPHLFPHSPPTMYSPFYAPFTRPPTLVRGSWGWPCRCRLRRAGRRLRRSGRWSHQRQLRHQCVRTTHLGHILISRGTNCVDVPYFAVNWRGMAMFSQLQ